MSTTTTRTDTTATATATGPAVLKVSKYDANAVKQVCDDETVTVLSESGYREATQLSTVRLVLGVLSVLIALLSHFAPLPPYPTLPLCLALYLLLTALSQLAAWRLSAKDAIFQGTLTLSQEEDIMLIVTSQLNTSSKSAPPEYVLCLKQGPRHCHEERLVIGDYIQQDGSVARAALRQRCRNTLDLFQQQLSSKAN